MAFFRCTRPSETLDAIAYTVQLDVSFSEMEKAVRISQTLFLRWQGTCAMILCADFAY